MEKLLHIEEHDTRATVNVGVCAGRHEMPVDNFIYDKIDDPTNVQALEETAWKWYRETVVPLRNKGLHVDINIYVTGLTVATVAILKVLIHCHEWAIDDDYPTRVHNGEISLWHFDSVGQKYYSQSVFTGPFRD